MRMRWSMKQAQMKGRMPELSVDASEDSGVLYLCARAPFILSIVYSFRFRFVSVSFFVAFHFCSVWLFRFSAWLKEEEPWHLH